MDHIKEYARRSIFYFGQYLNFKHDYHNTGQAKQMDELAYFAFMQWVICLNFVETTRRY